MKIIGTRDEVYEELAKRTTGGLHKNDLIVNQNFTYDITLKNLNVFTELLIPSCYLAPNTKLLGHYNNTNNREC